MERRKPNPYRRFFRQHPPDVERIVDLKHRHFRFLLPQGRFQKIKDRIRTAGELQRWLVRWAPADAYYSTACWLNPDLVGPKKTAPLLAQIFLSCDLAFDIDDKDLEGAREHALRLVEWLHRRRLAIRYIAFSGSKGFHVIAHDPNKYPQARGMGREEAAALYRKEIVREVEAAGINIDSKITTDTRRIIRIPGTINSKTGYVCTRISEEDLAKPMDQILKRVLRAEPFTPRIPDWGDDGHLRCRSTISGLLHRIGVRWQPPSSTHYETYLLNGVPGTRLYLPFFEYYSRSVRREKKVLDELARLQKDYRLGDLLLLRDEAKLVAVSLKPFDERRLEKMLGASTSNSRGSWPKYHRLFMRVGQKREEGGTKLADAPKYLRTLASDVPAGPTSRPHADFFADFGIIVRRGKTQAGDGSVSLQHSIVE